MPRTRLQLLTNPSFYWFAISCFLTSLGAGISYLALSWGVLQVHDAVAAVSMLMLSFWLPNVLLGPILGVFADKHSRKWLIICANGVRGTILIFFGLLFRHYVTVHFVHLLMIMLGLAFSLYLPAAIALIREIVQAEDLLYANSINNIAYELGFALGMGSAGFIVHLVAVPMTLFLVGIIFIISTLAMRRVKVITLNNVKKKSNPVHQDFKLGLKYLYQNKRLIIIYCVQLLLLVAFMTTPVLLAPFAKNVLHANASEFGGIEASLSGGIIVGGLFMPWLAKRIGLYHCIILFCFLLGIFFIWFSLNRHIIIADVIYFCLGIGLSVWPLIVTRAQQLNVLGNNR